jgi:cupin 2 domain-containing protein
MQAGNLFRKIANELPDEITESLVDCGGIRIERIVSKGHHSAADFWYDQPENEWVVLLKGEARLRFEKGNKVLHLTQGMYVNISSHERHRIDWTREDEETIWLAVFY